MSKPQAISAPPTSNTWDAIFNEFLKQLPKVASSYDPHTIFGDVCRMSAIALQSALSMRNGEKEALEAEYQIYAARYGKDGTERISHLFALVVEALEFRRSDFLGHVYEELNATKKGWGQFFTPDSVSRMMARCTMPGEGAIEPGRIITLSDPACGAGALLIEAAEAFIANGGRQGDILLYANDIDTTATDIAYIQFSLLGYPAIVSRMDSLSMKVYNGPWYTMGYFAHAMPMRLHGRNGAAQQAPSPVEGEAKPSPVSPHSCGEGSAETTTPPPVSQEAQPSPEAINVRDLVQAEFSF